MGAKSPFVGFMLVLIAVILVIGFYLAIDANDLRRRREETLAKEVGGLKAEVASLREALQSGQLVAATETPSSPKMRRFANLDVRDPQGVEGDTIVMAIQSETGNMNYIVNNEAQVADFWGLTYDSVAERKLTNPNIFEPKLAESWEISDDKMTYTIHLREGVFWHDFKDPSTGLEYKDVPVTAADFKFYIDVVQNTKIRCEPLRVYFQDLDQIKVLDDYTFQVIWKKRYFMSEELTLGLTPLPRHFYRFNPDKADEEFEGNNARNDMIVGCGPWIFERWERGKQLSFIRNEKYYAPKPHLKRIVYKVIKEPTARLQALRNGELDRIGLQPEQWVEESANPKFTEQFNMFRYTRRSYFYIGYNERRSPFDDRKVRVAMTHLVNRDRILKEVFLGLGRTITGGFFVESPYYDKAIETHPFDIEKAKDLLAEAGWRDTDGDGILDKDGKKLEFTFLAVSGSKLFERVAEIVREDCLKAGIVADIVPLEWSVYTQRLDEWNFDVSCLGWSMGWESDPYQIWHSSQADIKASSNYIGFKSPEADKLIEEARGEFDMKKRVALYHRFNRIIHEEQPYTFLIAPDTLIAQDKRFHNAKVYPMGMDINSYWVPLEEQKYRD